MSFGTVLCLGDDLDSKPRCHKQHSTGKQKKKKKRRKKDEENSSESDSAFVSKKRDGRCGQSLSLRCQEQLPDIIPKQVKTKICFDFAHNI